MEVLKLETWTSMFSPEELVPEKVQEYLDFVVQAVERYDPSRYSEWHHVMPKCIDQGKYRDQGVRINGADHFKSHELLIDCFIGRKKRSLAIATHRIYEQVRRNGESVSPESYEKVRKVMSETISISMTGSGNHRYGHHVSKETRDRMRSSQLGHKVSDETRRKIGDSNRNSSEETRQRIRESRIGMKFSDYHKKNLSESHKGNRQSEESKRKISESSRGRVWITNGEINKFIHLEESGRPPEGWRLGKIKRS